MSAPQFFDFEADFVQSLRCIPMQMRYKLDTCGVKLKLQQWFVFSLEERQQFLERSCESASEIAAYREALQALVARHTGAAAAELAIDPAPAWGVATQIPASVLEQASKTGVSLTIAQWQALTPLQRFALIKLSRPSHENHNFAPALKEFQLVG
jgi:hypothetical protein